MKKIIIGVTGSIAAIKIPELVRKLRKEKFRVSCVLTPSAVNFVTPLVLSTLSGEEAVADLFAARTAHLPHLQSADEADLFLIAPASAATLARCAQGLAEDMVSLVYLATKAPVLIAPAMHGTMWEHPATRKNVEILKERGAQFIGPEKGDLADGTAGPGRMSEVDDIIAAVKGAVVHSSHFKRLPPTRLKGR